MKRTLCLALAVLLVAAAAPAQPKKKPAPKRRPDPTWTDPAKAAAEDPDFSIQGEYGSAAEGAAWGVQVIAMGEGKFDAYLLEAGLPGLGWQRDKARIKLAGQREGKTVTLASQDKKITAEIAGGTMTVTRDGKQLAKLPRIERTSTTLGAKPPQGAVVLFDGTSADKWKNGKVVDGLLANTDCMSIPTFKSYTFHLEFRTPYKPFARGQGRGNSGVYHWGRYETQVLDSFGLTGEQNECGGIYSVAKPLLNACLPPLTWQTYDVEFTAPTFGADGKPTGPVVMTVQLNGIVIHKDVKTTKEGTTACPIRGPLTDKGGPIFLQSHGNPVFYRNIWVVPR